MDHTLYLVQPLGGRANALVELAMYALFSFQGMFCCIITSTL